MVGDYRVYTTAFDEVVFASDLAVQENAQLRQDLSDGAFEDFLNELEEARQTSARLLAQAAASLDRLKTEVATNGSRDPVTMLIDHSGSLRVRGTKQGHFWAYFTANLFASMAIAADAQFEILGFTTAQWQGGAPRTQWLQDGRPRNPGRLCPLRHIVYSEFDDLIQPDMRTVLRPDILKENVDGEALLWAHNRLKTFAPCGGDLVIVSDGAPVDDSTLSANHNSFLMDHLKAVIEKLDGKPGLRLHGVGIDHDLSKLYPNVTEVNGNRDFTQKLIPFFENILTAQQ